MHFDDLDACHLVGSVPGSCLSRVYTIPKGSFLGPLEEKQETGVFPIPNPYTLLTSRRLGSKKADGESPEQGWHHKTLEPGSVFEKRT